MRRSIFVICFIVTSILITGCNTSSNSDAIEDITISEKISNYLLDKGYNIVLEEGKTEEYVLEKELLLPEAIGPYAKIWMIQEIEPSDYFNKTIEEYKFIVKNHPLDHDEYIKNETTSVTVMVCEGKIIGGYSLHVSDDILLGGFYSLEGKTLEEITGMNYTEWSDRWWSKL
ncbi:hypothetical protein RH915_11095 [Serpentinicella sp. ANB-PHB4]|uniref:hypothetical protein n=1 Tax=Serpentinicella sp. ANB-PHB4 TaxID=3074076 RepID=UPI0028644680|nr:hypothetical protein [Serpentinicella sp. ANB-PHB4]MDR5660036.1 hypothetical protein [Serpentinicella sp. ANB-PHB4]